MNGISGIGRRLALSLLAGVVLLVSLVGPAYAILPIVPAGGAVINALVIRGTVGQVVVRTALPLVESFAQRIGTVGGATLIGSAAVAFCGTGSVLDPCANDAYSWLKAKLSGDGGETLGPDVPPIEITEAPQTWYKFSDGVCDASGACPQSTKEALCTAAGGYFSSVYVGQGGWAYNAGSDRCVSSGGVTAPFSIFAIQYCPSGTLQNGQCVRTGCPAGYTFVAGTCKSARYTSDGTPSFINNDGTWMRESRDPDADGLNPPVGAQTITGVDSYGNPVQVNITPNADGSMSVNTIAQRPPTAGQSTQTVQNQFTINPQGQVVNPVTNYYNGTSSQIINNYNTNNSNVTQTPTQTIPTDYARDATVQQTNTKLQSIIDNGLKIKEQGMPSAEGALSSAETKLQQSVDALKGQPAEITSANDKDTAWKISFMGPTSCSNPPAFVLARAGINWTPDLCAYAEQIGAVMSFLWYLLTLGSCLAMIRGTATGSA